MRTGVRHRSVRRGAGRVARPVGWAAAAALLALSLVGPSAVGAASPPQPTYGSAVVDGHTGDWSLSADRFSDLTDTGQADSPVRGHLYLRYDCKTETLYALVLGVDGIQFQQTRPEDAYIRIDGSGKAVSGNSGNDGTPPDFSWVNPDGKLADGFEGSAPLSPGEYTIRAHVLRPSERSDGYTPVDNIGRADPLKIVCKAEPTPTGSLEPTTKPTDPPTTAPTSNVKGETATPKTTLPPTSTFGTSGEPPSTPLAMVFLGLGLVIAGALVLMDKPRQALGRRRGR